VSIRSAYSGYSLTRRATLATVGTLVVMLTFAGVSLAVLFLKAQVDQSRITALTQANVASSTITAAVRFGGYDVISDSLRVFDAGPGHDSAAVYNRRGQLVAELVAPGEVRFPSEISGLIGWSEGTFDAHPVQHALRDEQSDPAAPAIATLVVNPNQKALRAALGRALLVLAVVLGITTLAGVLVAQALSRALLRPVAELNAWVEEVSASHNLAAPAPRGGGLEVNQLTTGFESLIAQVAEQNRELKRKQYELKASNAHLETMAFSDALTGLPNRPMFETTLATAIERANTQGSPLAVLFIDLDDLKKINDQHGHAKGDSALRATAARIRRGLRAGDFLARLAGDEFVVVSSGVTTPSEAVKLGERLAVWLGIALPEDDWAYPVRASIGVAVFPDHGGDVRALVHAADLAMYRAKAFPNDDAIRVVCAEALPHAASARRPTTNVIALPSAGRKSQAGKVFP
jgi:diguanylate cyclase (GGDEF)-like protein